MTNIFLLIISFVIAIQSVEIQEEIYYEIPNESVSHCVRRLNDSSSIGCSSKYEGNVGTIEIVFNNSELNSRLSSLKEDTILVMYSNLFISVNATNLILKNKFITGLIIFERYCNDSYCESDVSNGFSEDYKFPNKLFSFPNNISYNSVGTEYAFKNWPFPVAFIGKRYKNEQDKIISCYNKFNLNYKSNRKCGLEIKNFMAAVESAKIANLYEKIQDKFAGLLHPVYFFDDFTGNNYVVNTQKIVKSRPPESVIVLLSRLDSLSMFEKSAFNVHGTVTSASLLLSVMHLLMSQSEFQNTANLKKDVLFLFLDNESYDYLGSNRFFLDLKHKNVAKSSGSPINISHLGLILEFGELGFANFSDISFFYQNSTERTNNTLDESYLSKLSQLFQLNGFTNQYSVANLPPSSVQYFLNKKLIPAIVMADHKDHFNNMFYNSFLDNKPMMNNSRELIAIVNSVASFVYQEATGKKLKQKMNITDVVTPFKIIECFTENIHCDLLKEVYTTKIIDTLYKIGTPIPLQAHSGTKEISSDYRFSYLLRYLIVYTSGQKVDNKICDACSNCTNLTKLTFGTDNYSCFVTQVMVSQRFSFINETKSLWINSMIIDKQSVRMFVKAPNKPLLITGIVLTVTMTVFMTLISSRMFEIFHCNL